MREHTAFRRGPGFDMADVPRTPPPRCARHGPLMWYGDSHGKAKYRCAICVADAKIKIDRAMEHNCRRRAVHALFDAVRR